jgi:hypothetical protein
MYREFRPSSSFSGNFSQLSHKQQRNKCDIITNIRPLPFNMPADLRREIRVRISRTPYSALTFAHITFPEFLANHMAHTVVYCGLCIISAIIVYFWIPETKGLPIEEIGALFGDEVVVHLTADGHGVVEVEQVEDTTEKGIVIHGENL